jgi:opacity protein-like surface antigen
MRRRAPVLIGAGLGCCLSTAAAAQQVTVPPDAASPPSSSQQPPRNDGRAQYPPGLADSYVSLNVGYIHYPFSQRQLEPGHQAGSIAVPHLAARAMLFGHHFGKYVSAQVSYMRPVRYVKYRDLNGSGASRSVWMHFGTVTLQSRLPVGGRFSVYGEGGLSVTNRGGFDVDQTPGVKDAHFASVLLGGGVEYRVDRMLDFVVGSAYIPPRSKDTHPPTIFTSAGVRLSMRPLPAAQVAETVAAGFVFHENLIQAGYATDAFGFGVNNFLSKTVPVFWGGSVKVKRSLVSVQWQRNLFHTKKVFAFDVGASYSQWRSKNNVGFSTMSMYPVLRFIFLRLKPADVYASYSVAGPTYISKFVIDGLHTGSHFTFQDFMALGLFVGPQRRLNAEINLNHYSNGNILSENAGVKIPLAVKLGYAF